MRSGVLLSGGVFFIWLLSHLIGEPFAVTEHPLDWSALVTVGAELGALSIFLLSNPVPKTRTKATIPPFKLMGQAVALALVIWLSGMLLTPLLPSLSESPSHVHGVVPTPGVISSAAYFSIVNAGKENDALVSVTGDNITSISLHETTINANEVAQMRALGDVELTPNVRVDFAPAGKHVMLDGLPRELYEGDHLELTLHFASGRAVPVDFAVTLLTPTQRINFASADGFQISNAWVRATSSLDNLVTVSEGGYDWQLPEGFPLPRVPENNPMTEEKVELGRYLFYDVRLSGNSTESCSSCHLQALAFTDGRTVSVGSTGEDHPRNAISLTNSAYSANLTWANPNLLTIEQQVTIPMFGEHPVEMGITGNEDTVLNRFRQDEQYRTLFANAFADKNNPYTFNNISLALSSFTRTLISGNSPYDRYLRGERDAMSDSAKRGMNMFFSESLECHHCHTGFNMTLATVTANTTFEEHPFFNTGLYNIGGTGAYPPGNTGIHEVTNDPADMGRFRPPTLRNVALTAPYMHDGSIATLQEVIRFYMAGGREIADGDYAGDGRANPYKNGFVSGFSISDEQIDDLVAFLESLTDDEFITDPRFSDPFASSNGDQAANSEITSG